MKITVELSLYPLDINYKDQVIAFIKALQAASEVQVYTNRMSTYIVGDYTTVMESIRVGLKSIFGDSQDYSVIMKILPQELAIEKGFLNFE